METTGIIAYALLARQNPALPPSARSSRAVIGKSFAAGWVAAQYQRNFEGLAALCITASSELPDTGLLSRWCGSGRLQAQDRGGYFGWALRRLAEAWPALDPGAVERSAWWWTKAYPRTYDAVITASYALLCGTDPSGWLKEHQNKLLDEWCILRPTAADIQELAEREGVPAPPLELAEQMAEISPEWPIARWYRGVLYLYHPVQPPESEDAPVLAHEPGPGWYIQPEARRVGCVAGYGLYYKSGEKVA